MTRVAVLSLISCGIFLSYKCNCRCPYYMLLSELELRADEIVGNVGKSEKLLTVHRIVGV